MSKLPHRDGPFQFRELIVSAARTLVVLACMLFGILGKSLGKGSNSIPSPSCLVRLNGPITGGTSWAALIRDSYSAMARTQLRFVTQVPFIRRVRVMYL